MHLHILGICGTFMGGLAAIAQAAGHRVTGCDANVYPPMSTQLRALGIGLTEGWDPGQIDGVAADADVFVVGNVVSRGNPLMEAILDAGRPYVSGPQWLFENLLRDKWVLAVAGTHGKTTTAAMLAWILDCARLEPGFLIGGVPADFAVSARLTASPFFVIEADEYDTAFFDKRSKFVHYRPRTAILNNLEYDHADIFPDLAAIETQFHHLLRTVPRQGRVVVNGGEASLARVLARGCWSEVERFGLAEVPGTGPGWTIAVDGSILLGGAAQGTLAFGQAGRHNQLNALAAIAAARHAGVPVRESLAALAGFRGVKRRLEARGTVKGITVYDDFAHHPTAIATTIDGLKRKVGKARILAVLEPRSNTMKLGAMKDALPGSLALADRVFCYSANLGWDVAGALAPLGARLCVRDDLGALVADIVAAAQPGDQVLVMSNGGFGGIHDKLLAALAA
ncbi:MAG: UDP-N-acetylmuramate:L-alanyl-gamma-D-glutamyl-meso-diaminopimelate ligase [Betaproteobacteria bacterium]|jgi:UDP-N-acetylmuramate: L-alanyl-gamma-D-glutamyl-meso-diaminopimelate ligase|nr:UDP-N-acetylmuramate:L-alanyl-gamma-D-glutamyl-meso-diaminopimelate ligase [Betaproteobacteria bacterium]MBK7079565.1 UDP-N-acetylmuramate:L-alanyl-gamma-D-glutamyl-meso-diaminopimelate ligase [Betaproteobacteria bacterium]